MLRFNGKIYQPQDNLRHQQFGHWVKLKGISSANRSAQSFKKLLCDKTWSYFSHHIPLPTQACFMLLCKLPVIWSHSTIYQSAVFGDHFYLVYTVLIVKNRFLFLLCCKYDSIGSCKKNDDHWLDLTKMMEVKTQVTLYYRDNLPLQQLFCK